jgi:hypothetical protein
MRDKGESAFDDVVEEDSTTEKPVTEDTDEEDTQSSTESVAETGDDGVVDVEDSDPGFPFAEAEQHPVYLKGETWQSLQDTKYYTEGELLEQFGVRNAETREFDEAIAQLVAEELSPERIAEKIVENRGFE